MKGFYLVLILTMLLPACNSLTPQQREDVGIFDRPEIRDMKIASPGALHNRILILINEKHNLKGEKKIRAEELTALMAECATKALREQGINATVTVKDIARIGMALYQLRKDGIFDVCHPTLESAQRFLEYAESKGAILPGAADKYTGAIKEVTALEKSAGSKKRLIYEVVACDTGDPEQDQVFADILESSYVFWSLAASAQLTSDDVPIVGRGWEEFKEKWFGPISDVVVGIAGAVVIPASVGSSIGVTLASTAASVAIVDIPDDILLYWWNLAWRLY